MARAIERHDLDCVQMALNASRNGRFEELALPAANKKNLGIIAMKVTGQEFLVGEGAGKADMRAGVGFLAERGGIFANTIHKTDEADQASRHALP